MREIIFKAKRKHSPHEWITGDLNHIDGSVFIFPRTEDFPLNSPDWFEVNPSTVCQYTGLDDLKKKRIYENDMVNVGENLSGKIVYIGFNEKDWGDEIHAGFHIHIDAHDKKIPIDTYAIENIWVIGNIHD